VGKKESHCLQIREIMYPCWKSGGDLRIREDKKGLTRKTAHGAYWELVREGSGTSTECRRPRLRDEVKGEKVTGTNTMVKVRKATKGDLKKDFGSSRGSGGTCPFFCKETFGCRERMGAIQEIQAKEDLGGDCQTPWEGDGTGF